MSEFRIDQITNQAGTAGPQVAGIATFSSTSGLLFPSGDTRSRYSGADGEIVKNGLLLLLDAGKAKSYGGDGTTWRDLSGNSNNATLVNDVGFSAEEGGSLVFDGVNDYAQTIKNDIPNNSSYTLSCWFRITTLNSTFRPLIDSGNLGVGSGGFALAINNSNRLFIASDSGFTEISNSISANIWYNVVGTASLGAPYTLNVYLNGILGTVSSSNNTNTMTNQYSYVRIGQNINGSIIRFPGNISQVSIYNRALSASEVLQNYNALKGRYI